ncbi:glutamate racemase [Agriterribacter sp.]|uniref:glutamate racemase n=1 Tax=Agriterribacter sp. TaxID=2821509 RepID=UPI002CC55249|nr:glutamate racemase [Agriterribacter sp.]HRO44658.1 glutamate racemase [Agriterribacter sp.]HRQ16095.1 glutamate racemase [Agriterribacter sp.]
MKQQPIGVFDSGYGGLTILKEFIHILPQYDYLYLGDNARAPYGPRSFETVYRYTLQCVQWLFAKGCPLVIVACNTASAKALRTIQQNDLPNMNSQNRVLGVIRPTTETIGTFTRSNEVGILATAGTVLSESYLIETKKFYPHVNVYQEACPMWVPLVENNEYASPGADYFVEQHVKNLLGKGKDIDTVLLACTHYPLLKDKIRKYLPDHVSLLSQGEIVAKSLMQYLERHPEMEARCGKGGTVQFYTTDSTEDFDAHAATFFGERIHSEQINIE